MKIPFGYVREPDGNISIDPAQARVIQMIFQQYISGKTSGNIVKWLAEQQILSPVGNATWVRATIDKMLANKNYIPLIGLESYIETQFEKDRRSNIDYDKTGTPRKATRYSSQNVLSGLFVCAECDSNYRRITRSSGEVVWRCANRVKYGKEICKHAPTITEEEMFDFLCDTLDVSELDPQIIKRNLSVVFVNSDGSFLAKPVAPSETQDMTLGL